MEGKAAARNDLPTKSTGLLKANIKQQHIFVTTDHRRRNMYIQAAMHNSLIHEHI